MPEVILQNPKQLNEVRKEGSAICWLPTGNPEGRGRGVYTFLTRRIRITVSSTEQLFNGARTRLPLHFVRYLVGRPSADQENALGDTLQYRVDSVYVCMYLYTCV